ncbi:MAG: proteasome accessory factor [Solirubrobacteraceae bacterium]|jgi:proteasome accessory factor C|nr:proteasome accessory factor [Solirubrobacteraceae bacterium]
MAKDTEKLIRQLSLISFLMAERRPVTAPEIRTAVEGYSGMNEDAFARRFYADRAELESLGISLSVDNPLEGLAEQESYSLPPENFYLPPIQFTDRELGALQTALSLLDGEFAYAEPLRLALQQLSWGRPSPHAAPDQRALGLGITASAGGHDLSQRLVKVDTAISRRKTIVFEYHTMERDAVSGRKVDPYQLLFQGGQFYLLGHSHERDDVRVFRLSRIRGKVSYATKAEHDFQRPEDFDPRVYANRAAWQFGEAVGEAHVQVGERIAWQVQRHFGRFGRFEDDVFVTPYSNARLIVSWVLGLGEHARLIAPAELVDELTERVERLESRHEGEPDVADPVPASPSVPEPGDAEAPEAEGSLGGRRDAAIRPERFARLVTLASILIEAGREGRRIDASEVRERLQISDAELREDIQVLNVVNFGAGSYILYAEIDADGSIEVDPDAYSDSFAQPARLLPIEAKALVAAIDLIGEHLSEDALVSARERIVEALGHDPVDEGLQVAMGGGDDPEVAQLVSRAIDRRRLLDIEYYKENEDEFSTRRIEPYALMNGRDGWYVAAYDPAKEDVRHFRLDRIKRVEVTDERFEPRPEVDPAAQIDGWLRTGEVEEASRARVWISPERARWEREERTVVAELADGAVIVELGYKGVDWLVREVLKEAGDAAVLEPPEAREAVREAAGRLAGAASRR